MRRREAARDEWMPAFTGMTGKVICEARRRPPGPPHAKADKVQASLDEILSLSHSSVSDGWHEPSALQEHAVLNLSKSPITIRGSMTERMRVGKWVQLDLAARR